MIASVAPIANAAIAMPSMTRPRVRGEERRVGPDGRVRAVAVGDDVALRRRAGWPPPATSRRSGSPPPPRPRRPDEATVAMVPVAPRSRTALRSPSKAPLRTARSRSPAFPDSAAARPVRTRGHSLGVARNGAISRPFRCTRARRRARSVALLDGGVRGAGGRRGLDHRRLEPQVAVVASRCRRCIAYQAPVTRLMCLSAPTGR